MKKTDLIKTWTAALVVTAALPAYARIAVIESESVTYELPRSEIKTYIQQGTIQDNLKTVRQQKPGALSDDELVAIPDKYLTPELKKKQAEAKERLKTQTVAQKPKKAAAGPVEKGDIVKIRGKNKQVISLKLDEAVWVPPTAATNDAILAPQKKLPEVEILQSITVETSGEVKKEINPGDRREIFELFAGGKTSDTTKKPLLQAFNSYQAQDYATAVTLALGVMSDSASSADTKLYARYLAGHALYQAGFYASSVPLLIDLVSTKLRRTAVGILSLCLEKTRDDGPANVVLSKVSLSQIPQAYQPLYSFHLGRILLNRGVREAALAAFQRVPVDHPRFAEAQYYEGVIKAAEVPSNVSADAWDKEGTEVNIARVAFENALTNSHKNDSGDLQNLIRISLARLAYQAKQYNQSIFLYQEVETNSPFAREATYESAWALYRVGEFNRSLGMLHPLGSAYFESRDLPELWILRSLNYLKLCRFDEAQKSANTFEHQLKLLSPDLNQSMSHLKSASFNKPSDLAGQDIPDWIKSVLYSDPVYQKDLTNERLILAERERLQPLRENLRVGDRELRESAAVALQGQLDKKLKALATAQMPYLQQRSKELLDEYSVQRQRLDFLRFEIYSQAERFPRALERPEAKKMIAQGEFLPGVFLKGHEILWKFNGEYWSDELRSYDYFIPTECKSEQM